MGPFLRDNLTYPVNDGRPILVLTSIVPKNDKALGAPVLYYEALLRRDPAHPPWYRKIDLRGSSALARYYRRC